MGTSSIIMAKLTGVAAREVDRKVSHWLHKMSGGTKVDQITENYIQKELQQLLVTLQSCAHDPPVVFFHTFIDPWTVAPLRHVEHLLESHPEYFKYVTSGEVDCLFIRPVRWEEFLSEIQQKQRMFSSDASGETEVSVIFAQLVWCARSWEGVLSASKIDRALVLISQTIRSSWSDEEVIAKSTIGLTWS